MALQTHIIRMLGSYKHDDVVGYIQNGIHRIMQKSSLTAETFWNHPNFQNSRLSSNRMSEASKIASAFYRALPACRRHYLLYKQLTALAFRLLKSGEQLQYINQALAQHAQSFVYDTQPAAPTTRKQNPFPFAREVTNGYILIHATHLEYLEDRYGADEVQQLAQNTINSLQQQSSKQQYRKRRVGVRRSCLRSQQAAVLGSASYNKLAKHQRPLILYFHLKHLAHRLLKTQADINLVQSHLNNYSNCFIRLYNSDAANPQQHNILLQQHYSLAA